MKTFQRGESIKVRLGEEFELYLEVLAASGYEWQVPEKTPGLSVLGSHFKAPGTNQIGGASEQIFRLRIDHVGSHALHLVCKRPWDTTPSESLTVEITALR
jgi:predicted secreted protein